MKKTKNETPKDKPYLDKTRNDRTKFDSKNAFNLLDELCRKFEKEEHPTMLMESDQYIEFKLTYVE